MIDPEALRGLPAVVRRHETELHRLMDERQVSRNEAVEIIKRETPRLAVAFRQAHQAHLRRHAREFDPVRHFLH